VATSIYRIAPDSKVDLDRIDPAHTGAFERREDAEQEMTADLERLRALQERFYVDGRYSLLLVLQGMDTSGKDGMVRHLSGALNLVGAEVTSFKAPNSDELDHDFLWRVHLKVPARKRIGIFNRSHYEDVLVVRVQNLVPPTVWRSRYAQINEFENILTMNGVIILKCFLHISKQEQKERLLARLGDKDKLWKLEPSDLAAREQWDQYQEAYAAALSKCSTKEAPWHVIPANRKWFRNYAVTRLMVESLEALALELPAPKLDPSQVTIT
jgi:PPK2 family polyphosphate:nucleotide phosphotransferase